MSPQEFAREFASSLSWNDAGALLLVGRNQAEVSRVTKTTNGDTIQALQRRLAKSGHPETASLRPRE